MDSRNSQLPIVRESTSQILWERPSRPPTISETVDGRLANGAPESCSPLYLGDEKPRRMIRDVGRPVPRSRTVCLRTITFAICLRIKYQLSDRIPLRFRPVNLARIRVGRNDNRSDVTLEIRPRRPHPQRGPALL